MTITPVRTEPGPLTAEERDHIADLLGDDVRPASAKLLMNVAALVRDCRVHEHPRGEDYYCGNLAGWVGERAPRLLRRLLDLEAENARLRGEPADLTPIVVHWDRLVMYPTGQDTDTIVCCKTDAGHPVALFLDEELREALGLQLVEPDPDPRTPAQEEARARAYLAGVSAGYGIGIDEWTGQEDGTAVYEGEDGITLTHTPTGATPFIATVPCRHHTTHVVHVTWKHEYTEAAAATGRCNSQAGPDSPLSRFLQDLADQFAEDHDGRPVTVIPGTVVRAVQHNGAIGRHRRELES